MRTIALCLLLAGCSAAVPCIPKMSPPVIQKIPVPVACVNAGDIPPEPGTTTLTGDARNDDALLAAKVGALRVWGRSLVAMLQPCSTSP